MLIYLASPYSHLSLEQERQRYELACQISGDLIAKGFSVFSPIAHGHAISTVSGIFRDWNSWKTLNSTILRRCDQFWIAAIWGWELSEGVRAEFELAKNHRIQCFLLCPETFRRTPMFRMEDL